MWLAGCMKIMKRSRAARESLFGEKWLLQNWMQQRNENKAGKVERWSWTWAEAVAQNNRSQCFCSLTLLTSCFTGNAPRSSTPPFLFPWPAVAHTQTGSDRFLVSGAAVTASFIKQTLNLYVTNGSNNLSYKGAESLETNKKLLVCLLLPQVPLTFTKITKPRLPILNWEVSQPHKKTLEEFFIGFHPHLISFFVKNKRHTVWFKWSCEDLIGFPSTYRELNQRKCRNNSKLRSFIVKPTDFLERRRSFL